MGLTIEAKVGKKYAIYLPKAVVNAMELKEGQKVLLKVSDRTVILQSVQDPIELAVSGTKFSKLTPEKAERISLEQQRRAIESNH